MEIQLDKLNVFELGMLFPIIISEPNSEWFELFEIEKTKIEQTILKCNIIQINHIGSTAIPNLKAKPTIDIILEIHESTDNELIIKSMLDLGYHYINKPENQPPHMMFVKGYTTNGFVGQAYHVHVRYTGDWDELYFRDYLKKNNDIAKEYENLKIKLAIEFRNDREKYTEGKTDLVKRINNLAHKEMNINK